MNKILSRKISCYQDMLKGVFNINGTVKQQPAVERRSGDRPWCEKNTVPERVDTPVPLRATSSNDGAWEEF